METLMSGLSARVTYENNIQHILLLFLINGIQYFITFTQIQFLPSNRPQVAISPDHVIINHHSSRKRIMSFFIYLSGEIHTSWREEIITKVEVLNRGVEFSSANTDHNASDAAGDMLGSEENPFWRDHKSAKVNAIHTRNQIQKSDLVIIRFGQQYKQWNAAFDAGYCTALNIPYITLHDDDIIHALKEVDAAAMARATDTDQIVEIIDYLTK